MKEKENMLRQNHLPIGLTDEQKMSIPKVGMHWIDPNKKTYTLINEPIIDKLKVKKMKLLLYCLGNHK